VLFLACVGIRIDQRAGLGLGRPYDRLRRAIAELKEYGFWIVGLDGESKETIYDRIFPNRLAIVLGSEGKGVRPVNSRECDFLVSIPMMGKIASLNVSVAGAVFLYELVRQSRSIDKESGKR
jgi:23S rRNA (guanosine2251-2'-O)-methyltransferase